jgi:NADH dehydrogenase FAD-containing subunit
MKHLVLLGADPVHVHLLARLAQRASRAPLPFRVTLVAPYPQLADATLLPGLVSGQYSLEQCSIALDGLLKASEVNYVQGRATHIDAARQSLTVDTKTSITSLDYDVLSVNAEPVMDRELIERTLPGAREHALFTRPSKAFPALWDRLLELATGRALRIAVIGAEAAGVELAFALRERLPHCAVTLICGGAAPAANYSEEVQQRVLRRLKACGITVLPQTCSAIAAGHIVLDQVTNLACDAPVLSMAGQAPPWLASPGLALDEQGLIAVNEFQQSTSHPQVFATGDVASHIGAPRPKNGADAERAASNLATNLFAALSGLHLQAYKPPVKCLSFVSCGARYAIASRGHWSAEGGWVAYWKNWVARHLMARIKAG